MDDNRSRFRMSTRDTPIYRGDDRTARVVIGSILNTRDNDNAGERLLAAMDNHIHGAGVGIVPDQYNANGRPSATTATHSGCYIYDCGEYDHTMMPSPLVHSPSVSLIWTSSLTPTCTSALPRLSVKEIEQRYKLDHHRHTTSNNGSNSSGRCTVS